MRIRRNRIRLQLFVIQLGIVAFVVASRQWAAAQSDDHSIYLRVGQGNSMTDPVLRSLFLSFPKKWFPIGNGPATVYIEQNVTFSEERRRLDFIAGVAAMVHVELVRETPRISIEAGIGVNFANPRRMGGRALGSNFLFSPTVGAGLEVPWANEILGVSYMFRHLSNAGLLRDNDGINFQYIVFSLKFREL